MRRWTRRCWNKPSAAKAPELLPDKTAHQSWDAWLHALLFEAERKVLARHQAAEPDAVTWGMANTASIAHPFSAAFSWLRPVLDMPAQALAGCSECVRWNAASVWLLVQLGQNAILQLRLALSRRILATPLARLQALGPARLLA